MRIDFRDSTGVISTKMLEFIKTSAIRQLREAVQDGLEHNGSNYRLENGVTIFPILVNVLEAFTTEFYLYLSIYNKYQDDIKQRIEQELSNSRTSLIRKLRIVLKECVEQDKEVITEGIEIIIRLRHAIIHYGSVIDFPKKDFRFLENRRYALAYSGETIHLDSFERAFTINTLHWGIDTVVKFLHQYIDNFKSIGNPEAIKSLYSNGDLTKLTIKEIVKLEENRIG